jgi:predicted transcriptional regulator
MKKTAPISFRIQEGLKKDLQALADADRRSLSAYIELALEAHVEREKGRSAKDKRTR